jgi:hypothetical protein
LTVVNCTVSGNSTSGSSDKGGGIYNGGTATIANSIISGNSSDAASGSGGGIYNDGSAMTITNSTISGNSDSAPNVGGKPLRGYGSEGEESHRSTNRSQYWRSGDHALSDMARQSRQRDSVNRHRPDQWFNSHVCRSSNRSA